jgi:hypothetical protein
MSAVFPLPENMADRRALRSPDIATSGVSWGAIIAGAFAAASLSFILLVLGFGLGLSSVSPWSNSGVSAETIGVSTIVWVAFTQIGASALGGYLAGRLRVKWVRVHTDEVYFRDTAHGLLTWAVASLAALAVLTSTIASLLDSGIKVGAAITAGATTAVGISATQTAGSMINPGNYYVDSLFRAEQVPVDALDGPTRTEVANIFGTSLASNSLSSDDRQYIAKIVAKRTGLTQAEAEKRVGDIYNRASTTIAETKAAAKLAADNARKAAAHLALWMFVALLGGAFCASLAATYGGKQRDQMKTENVNVPSI